MAWTKYEYGTPNTGHWTITNGHMRFDIHPLFNASGRTEKYPNGVIVSAEQADQYAISILDALNTMETL